MAPFPSAAHTEPHVRRRVSPQATVTYGENDKSSRRAIPFRKRYVNKANRHHDRQILLGSAGIRDADGEDATDERLHGRRRKVWRKWRDVTLRQDVEWQLRRRARLNEAGQLVEGQRAGDGDVETQA